MTPTELAALLTAGAGLLAALSQWLRLFGLPFTGKRNGNRAWLRYIEDRLTAAERALADCLALQAPPTERHRTQPHRWRNHPPPSRERNPRP